MASLSVSGAGKAIGRFQRRIPGRWACACAALLSTACGHAPAPTASTSSPRPSAYVNEILNIMQDNSVNRDRVNWTDFRAQVTQTAQGAQTNADLYPAISLALRLLDDHHSFYQAASGPFVGNPTSPRCIAASVASPSTPPDIGYVRVTAFSSTVPNADTTFADEIERQIRSRDAPDLVGWIVDLRGNGGGNMWPMIAGIGPVLGEGVAGFFVPPAGAPPRDGAIEVAGRSVGRTSSSGRPECPTRSSPQHPASPC